MRMNLCSHTIGHEMLRLRIDHAILFGNQEPRRLCFPRRRWGWFLNALNRDWPLHSSCNDCLFGRSFVGNRALKATVRDPNKAMGIGSQLGRFRGLWVAIEDLSYGLALIGRERRDINQ